MTTELYYLVLTAALTTALWIPYLINAMLVRGIGTVLSGAPYETDVPLSLWAQRLKAAHNNAVENLGVFATLVLVANVANISTTITVAAATVYFWARIAHYIIYGLGIPALRTMVYMIAWAAQITFVWQILAGIK